ncbi:MAG: diguanylate cyclase [Pyrinomonadaceae bacterium]
MYPKPVKVLLVEDNAIEALVMEAIFNGHKSAYATKFKYEVVRVERVSQAIDHLTGERTDAVLLDLSLPDARELEALHLIRDQFPDVPVVVLTGLSDEELASQAIEAGAQDYFVKGEFNEQVLLRAVRYAIERHQLTRSLSLTDELTGLYNRRGFYTLAEQQVKIARRTGGRFLVFYADMDGLKAINDTLGHHAGSQAIAEVGRVLRETFRESDIVARLGGDEFVALMLDSSEDAEGPVLQRLEERLKEAKDGRAGRFPVALSVGFAFFSPEGGSESLEEALHRADQMMYANKRSRRELAGGVERHEAGLQIADCGLQIERHLLF